jgi:hypothetical protein
MFPVKVYDCAPVMEGGGASCQRSPMETLKRGVARHSSWRIDSPLIRDRVLSLKFVDLLGAGHAGENPCRIVEVIIHQWAATVDASVEVGGRLHPRSAELKQVLAMRPGKRLGDIRLVLEAAIALRIRAGRIWQIEAQISFSAIDALRLEEAVRLAPPT